MTEFKLDIPLIEDAASTLKRDGFYSKDMSPSELSDVMKGVIDSILSKQGAVSASVPLMDVKIEKMKGQVSGTVQVEKPIKATIKIDCVLGNNPNKEGHLELVDLKVEEHAGFFDQIALSLVGVEGKARNVLSNPNSALRDVLEEQLSQKGVRLDELSLSFTEDNKLGIKMKSWGSK